jgi:GTP-binding protein HflX
LLVFNKLDVIDPALQPLKMLDSFGVDGVQIPRVFVSARSGEGLARLRQWLAEYVVQRGASDAQQSHASPEDDSGLGTIRASLSS